MCMRTASAQVYSTWIPNSFSGIARAATPNCRMAPTAPGLGIEPRPNPKGAYSRFWRNDSGRIALRYYIRSMDALTVHRLHFRIPPSPSTTLPAVDHGPRSVILVLKTMALGTATIATTARPGSGPRYLPINFAMAWLPGHSHGIRFGTNWGALLQSRRKASSDRLSPWKRVLLLPGIRFLGAFSCSERSASGPRPTGSRLPGPLPASWLSGFFIVATTPGCSIHRYRIGRARRNSAQQFVGPVAESMAAWQYLHDMIGSVITPASSWPRWGASIYSRAGMRQSGRIFRKRLGVVAAWSPPS